jgi:hypothetical protein
MGQPRIRCSVKVQFVYRRRGLGLPGVTKDHDLAIHISGIAADSAAPVR